MLWSTVQSNSLQNGSVPYLYCLTRYHWLLSARNTDHAMELAPRPAATKRHKQGGLEQQKHCLTVLEGRSLRSKCQNVAPSAGLGKELLHACPLASGASWQTLVFLVIQPWYSNPCLHLYMAFCPGCLCPNLPALIRTLVT